MGGRNVVEREPDMAEPEYVLMLASSHIVHIEPRRGFVTSWRLRLWAAFSLGALGASVWWCRCYQVSLLAEPEERVQGSVAAGSASVIVVQVSLRGGRAREGEPGRGRGGGDHPEMRHAAQSKSQTSSSLSDLLRQLPQVPPHTVLFHLFIFSVTCHQNESRQHQPPKRGPPKRPEPLDHLDMRFIFQVVLFKRASKLKA
jgi:hypothetical protein